jgi:hypothetical protein
VHLTEIIESTITHAALDVSIKVLHRPTSFLGTEDGAVLIGCALPFSAHHGSVLVLDALCGIDWTAGGQCPEASDEESIFHDIAP